jgi:hypothetical protein
LTNKIPRVIVPSLCAFFKVRLQNATLFLKDNPHLENPVATANGAPCPIAFERLFHRPAPGYSQYPHLIPNSASCAHQNTFFNANTYANTYR